MNLRTYRAYTLQQALDAVREDLGPSAVILRTRTVRQGGFLGLGMQTIVEVTASDRPPPGAGGGSPSPAARGGRRVRSRDGGGAPATAAAADRTGARGGPGRRRPVELEVDRGGEPRGRADGRSSAAREAPGAPAAPREPGAAAADEERASAPRQDAADVARPDGTGGHESRRPGSATDDASDGPLDLEAERARTRALARRMLAQHERREAAGSESAPVAADPVPAPAAPAPAAPAPAAPAPAAPGPRPRPRPPLSVSPPRDEPREAARIPAPPHAATPPRPVLRTAEDPPAASDAPAPVPAPAPAVSSTAERPAAAPSTRGTAEDAAAELEVIGGVVGDVLRAAEDRRRGPLPAPLFERRLSLLAQDMSPSAVDALVASVRSALSADELERPASVDAALRARLAALVPVAREALPARSPDGRPLTIAFIGPTGVGKTTTIAKLAAALRLRHGRSVGLVTADTYRIAAVDQLRTYADIIGVPLRVAVDPESMQQAMLELADRDVIVVDTAGRSQRDVGRLAELRRFVEAAEPHQVHLVLSGTAGRRALEREAAAFAPVGASRLVLTKLDEAVGFGMLVEAVHRIGLPLSLVTTGQEVPDDLERADAGRLADRVLAGEEPGEGS